MSDASDERPQAERQPQPRGQRGTVTSRPSRDSILQRYAEQDAQRIARTRAHANEAMSEYQRSASRAADRESQRLALLARQAEQEELLKQRRQEEVMNRQRAAQMAAARQRAALNDEIPEGRAGRDMVSMRDNDEIYARDAELGRRGRPSHPLSAQEGRERARDAQEAYEFERASRDPLSQQRYGRRSDRRIIDARGSIDSRAFNEHDMLVGYSVDEQDKPEPLVDSVAAGTRWHSRAGQGFDAVPDAGSAHRFAPLPIGRKQAPLGATGYGKGGSGVLPKLAIALVAIVVVIIIAVIFL